MRKGDVPLAGRPVTYYVGSGMFWPGYVLLVALVPDCRPGIIEAALALVVGSAGGWILGRAYIGNIMALAEASVGKPWIGWAAVVAYPLPFRRGLIYRLILVAVFFGSIAVCAVFLVFLTARMPGLGWPWLHAPARPDDRVFASMPPVFALYMALGSTVLAIRVSRWYAKLPD